MININIDYLHIILVCIGIYGLVTSIFNKIRYECIKLASDMVASVELNKEMSGEEKFALVILWIDSELPRIFRNSLVRNFLDKIVQTVYENSKEYMQNYIKRKTGYDVSELVYLCRSEQEKDID